MKGEVARAQDEAAGADFAHFPLGPSAIRDAACMCLAWGQAGCDADLRAASLPFDTISAEPDDPEVIVNGSSLHGFPR